MATDVIKIGPDFAQGDVIARAAGILSAGGLVAFPTETVYGVGARADLPQAMERLRELKGRSAAKAFTVHIGSREGAVDYAPKMSGLTRRLMRKAWPGPLTLILPVSEEDSPPILEGRDESAREAMYYNGRVGLRCPDDAVAAALLLAVPHPVVAASANLAGNQPPQTGDDVLRELDGRIDLLIDSGRTRYNKASTIVQVNGQNFELVREGVYDARIVERLASLRILFVCSGNTCRSPMAAALAERVLAERLGCHPSDLTARGIVISSAGTSGGYGGAADHAVTVMARRGLDLSEHASTPLTLERLHQSDYTFAMTRAHRDAIVRMDPTAADRVRLLLDDRGSGWACHTHP